MTSIPSSLDESCGVHLTYRELIECGETWTRLSELGLDNIPRAVETFTALRNLCVTILDPTIGRFGCIVLTYGFASPSLTKHIAGRIAPELDQHAAHEVNRKGAPICPRLGAAVDFLVPGVDSREVAKWIASTTAFDRLYFYDPDRPLHVSVGPENTRQVVHMRPTAMGRRVPRVIPASQL